MKESLLYKKHVFSGESSGPRALLIAGVHGDEWEGIAALHRLVQRLPDLDVCGRITVVPIANFSAFELAERCGADGLNLARACPGNAHGSPTQQVARELSDLIENADYLVDLHTGGTRYQVWPLAGYMLVKDAAVLNQQRRLARALGLPLVWGTWGGLEGRTLSVARDAGVPAIYAEYLGGSFCSAGVEAYFQGCLNVLAEMGNLDESHRQATPPPRVVEDDRENSGHLQINHPAPCAGFFEPLVKLGERVERGQILGALWERARRIEIGAAQSGEVLMLRAVCRVEADEMLAVILEESENERNHE